MIKKRERGRKMRAKEMFYNLGYKHTSRTKNALLFYDNENFYESNVIGVDLIDPHFFGGYMGEEQEEEKDSFKAYSPAELKAIYTLFRELGYLNDI